MNDESYRREASDGSNKLSGKPAVDEGVDNRAIAWLKEKQKHPVVRYAAQALSVSGG